jgi:ABC-type transporter Mla MlaB component
MTTQLATRTRQVDVPSSKLVGPSAPERTSTRIRMRVPADMARELDRYVSAIVAALRRRFDDRGEDRGVAGFRELILDLSDVPVVPHSALMLLVTLLRRTLGDDVTITLTGVSAAVLPPLTAFDLPHGVAVIDSRRRRWSG